MGLMPLFYWRDYERKSMVTIFSNLTLRVVFGVGGGLANFIMKLNQATEPQPVKTLFIRFLGEMFLAGFAGLTTFLLCREWGLSLNYTAVMVAMAGNLGGKAISQMSKLMIT